MGKFAAFLARFAAFLAGTTRVLVLMPKPRQTLSHQHLMSQMEHERHLKERLRLIKARLELLELTKGEGSRASKNRQLTEAHKILYSSLIDKSAIRTSKRFSKLYEVSIDIDLGRTPEANDWQVLANDWKIVGLHLTRAAQVAEKESRLRTQSND